ncbi:MAG: PAS domain S-box protein [Luteolibacter sp.]
MKAHHSIPSASSERWIASAAGLGTAGIGAAALVGWAMGIEVLKRVVPWGVAMRPNTALAFVFAGAALWLLERRQRGAANRALATGGALAVLVIGLLSLIDYLLGMRSGIDEWLFKFPQEEALPYPARMVPATALNFTLLGPALLLVKRGHVQLVMAVALVAGLSALLALAGHLYGAELPLGMGGTVAMAIHTAAAFLILSTGVAAASLDERLLAILHNNSSARVLMRRLLPAAFVVPVVLEWLRLQGLRAGFYDNEFGTALLVVAVIFAFVIFIWWSARTVVMLDMRRERAEETTRASEARFRSLLESAPDAVVIANEQGEILLVNAQNERLFGYHRDELLGRKVEVLIPHGFCGGQPAHSEHEEGLASGLELFGRHKDGHEFPVEISMSPLATDEGVLVTSAIRDITERKRSDAVLETERDLLRALMDNVPYQIYFKDRESRFLRNNRAHLARFGLTGQAQAAGKTDFDFFPPEHAVEAREDELRVMETGLMIDVEQRVAWPDGRVDWELTNKMPLRDASGEIIGTFGITHDITSRKCAEDELKSLSDRLQLATNGAAIGIWDYEPANDHLIWDEQMFRIAGIAPEDFGGNRAAWEAIVHPEDLLRETETLQCALRTEKKFSSEFRVIWPNRSIHFIQAEAIALNDASGRVLRFIGTCRDVTEQRKAEDDLRRAMAELERSNTELEQFAYVASHDLQEPLRAVTGCVQLLQKIYGDKLGDDAGELIRHAVEGAARMRTLIDDLLAFSRVGTHGKPFERTDSNAMLEAALGNLTVAIDESQARITHDPLPTLDADPTQLQQLFQNLIGNAVKFHGVKPPEIHVSATGRNGKWLFSVRDNGIGIEPQYRERIFVIFQRLHTRTEYAGTGVGLAVCKRIVERHGGDIWVESEPGQGSTFFFTIPEKINDQR